MPFGQPGQPGQSGQFGQPGQADQPGQGSQPFGQPGQQAQSFSPGPAGASPFPQPPGQAAPFGPPGHQQLASWGQRVGGYLLDLAPVLAVVAIGGLVMIGSITAGAIIMGLGWLGGMVWLVLNRWIQAGKTGQSLGRRMMGIKLVGEETGAPIGAGSAFVRDLCHAADSAACYVGFLWPLWDEKNQTFADKIVKTIVVTAPKGN
ncbi:RDD family protein [Amycolatopsis sp. 195334CR]|nr:RDD family protein [Amycolatopsis sp. 195334CR]